MVGLAGLLDLGYAAFFAIGAYTSALLSLTLSVPVGLAIIAGGLMSAALGTILISPSFRLRGHYVTIATLGVGEIVMLVILNWDSLTHGPVGLTAIPPLSFFGGPLLSGTWIYEIALCTLIVLAFLGGIFISWNNLPSGAQFVGKMLPSYHLAQLGWDSAGGFALHASDAIALAAWAVGLAAVALLRWRREASATA